MGGTNKEVVGIFQRWSLQIAKLAQEMPPIRHGNSNQGTTKVSYRLH